MALQMLTANRLRDGAVLYWKSGGWAASLREGELFATASDADAALAAAQAFVAANEVVNPYLFDMRDDGTPVKEREIIRAAGPSVLEQSTSPLWGDRNAQRSEAFRVGGDVAGKNSPHPENPSDFSTSPQGEGEGEFDVSI